MRRAGRSAIKTMIVNPQMPLATSVVYKRNPDVFMRPSYRISPFSTSDLARVSCLNRNREFDHLSAEFFGGREFRLTGSGRAAIEIALEIIGVNKQDLVSIVTTSNNYYVSSCVTSAIEKHCLWNRTIGPDTAVIFVIHEFGCLYKSGESLKEYGVPIIGDYAHSFASRYTASEKFADRLTCDYAVFSLPKFLPVQFGGVLIAPKEKLSREYLDTEIRCCLEASLAQFFGEMDSAISGRKEAHRLLEEKFVTLGFTPYFDYSEGEVPGAFLFRADLTQEKLQEMKIHTQSYGIESSVFYGENAFFIPCHHSLTAIDLEYFYEVVAMFMKERVAP